MNFLLLAKTNLKTLRRITPVLKAFEIYSAPKDFHFVIVFKWHKHPIFNYRHVTSTSQRC